MVLVEDAIPREPPPMRPGRCQRRRPTEERRPFGKSRLCGQIGGSIGTSLLSTIYATAVTGYLTRHPHVRGLIPAAAVHGDTMAFWWAAGIFGLGFLLALVVLPV